ncbi:MAG: cobalamin-binding protein [Chloroflexi bacterium]|nr:cobalamin-binding protein [Chloroflexota bacterium]
MKRIVSLLPSATDTVGALGLASWLVGVSHECDWPESVRSLPRLTRSRIAADLPPARIDSLVSQSLHAHRSLYTLDVDLLRALRPDVILTQELCDVCAVNYDQVLGAARLLHQDGGEPTIVSLEPRDLAGVFEAVQVVADELGERERGVRLVAALRARLAELRERGRQIGPRWSVLVLEWPDPPFAGGHWIAEMVEIAGGRNVPLQAALRGKPSSRVNWEQIQENDPDLIVVAPCGYDRARAAAAIAELGGRAEWERLRAVREGRVFPVDANSHFSRPGPRLIEGIAELQAILQSVSAV